MSQMKGAIFSMAIFIAFIVPFLLNIGIGSLHQHAFMKITTEVTEAVKEEGGLTDKIQKIVERLKTKGYSISFQDSSGGSISGKQDFGKSIVIDFIYKYNNVRGEQEINTQSVVFVSRR